MIYSPLLADPLMSAPKGQPTRINACFFPQKTWKIHLKIVPNAQDIPIIESMKLAFLPTGVALTYSPFIESYGLLKHEDSRSCGIVHAMLRQHRLSFPVFAFLLLLLCTAVQKGGTAWSFQVANTEARGLRGESVLLAVYPKMHRAGSTIPQDFLLHVQKYVRIDVCRMNLFHSSVSLICYVLLGCLFCRLLWRAYVLFTTNAEVRCNLLLCYI